MKKLDLKKFQIAKLNDYSLIKGGNPGGGDDGTILGNKKPRCYQTSKVIIWEEDPDN